MGMIKSALRKPITVLVIVAGLFFFGINAIRTIKIDIFPDLNLPVIYISHPYGGFTPNQMEAYFGKAYVNLLLYVSGVKSIETRNISGLTLMKLTFYEGTNMAQAAAEVTAYTNRAQASFPPGSQPPFILRFDASTLPVGQLVLTSPTRTNNELLDLANIYVRSSFTTIPGLVAPAPFGGNVRSIVIKVDPQLLRQHSLTPDQIVTALRDNNQNSPAGNVRIGDYNYLAPSNTVVQKISDFGNIAIYKNGIQTVFLRDVATVEDGADITSSYALVNGKRSVYLPITKSADASTWEVVQNLKKAIPHFQSLLPPDVKLSYVFDQSVYVINAVKSLAEEGAIGAVLTGLMVLLFLGDKRGALIVILTIPIALVSGILFLSLFHQTINIMTLSGLSLAIGILVDESTVTIENIHQHFDMGKPKALAIWDACKEIAFPKLLILFCILAVFAPAFTMKGIPGALFLPLALAIGFSMITSYLLAQTFVPIMANWVMKNEHEDKGHADGFALEDEGEAWEQKEQAIKNATKSDGKLTRFDQFRLRFLALIDRMMPSRKPIVLVYAIGACGLAFLMLNIIGRDVLPKVNSGTFQVRLRAADGTRLERTEAITLKALHVLDQLVGHENIEVTSAMVGQHPGQFSTSPIYLFLAGPQEAVLQVNLKEDYKVNLDELKERFRAAMHKQLPQVALSFEPIELTDKILSQGSPTPVEIAISGKNKKQNVEFAFKVLDKLKKIPYLRDVQIGQSFRYPTIDITIDRQRASQLGVSLNEISRSLTASTSSSRFTEKNVWLDEKAGQSYAVQVEVPEYQMSSLNDIREIPVLANQARPVLGDVADVKPGITFGENDNIGAIPMLTVTANLNDKDLGTATNDVKKALASLGELPRGLTVEPRGLSTTLIDTLDSLQSGLLVAVVVIFLMLAANFQSFKMSFVVLSTVPAVLFGSLLLVKITGATLNLQSYMGMIMSVGVSISNAVLLITNAEELRKHNGDALKSAREAVALRLRPVLMTSLAMVVGMIPMASGLGEGGDQTSPLGRAVIGGLVASTFAALLILPLVFAWVQGNTTTDSVSLDPEDKESKYYVPLHHHENRSIAVLAGMALTCTLMLGACHSDKKENEEVKQQEAQEAALDDTPVKTATVENGKLSSSIAVPGELVPYQQVDLYAKINSYVKKLLVDIGSQVHAGQLLATLEAPEINSQLAGAQSRIKQQEAVYFASKATYDRLVNTSKTPGTISQNDLEQAEAKKNADYANVDAAKSAYKEIASNLNYLEIRAPFDGVITARNINTGAYVGPGGKGSDPLFVLQDQGRLRLVVSVPEAYIGGLNHKDDVTFTVRELPGEHFSAKIARLAGALDEKLRSERVEMDVYNKSSKLLPHMYADVEVPLPSHDSTLIVPKSAVVSSTEKVFIIKVDDHHARWVDVKKGFQAGDKIEIYGDLKAGDKVITDATDEIRDGQKVKD